MKKVSKLKVVQKIEPVFKKIAGYRFYIGFEDTIGMPREYLTNNEKLYNSLEEGNWYKIQYEDTNRYVDRKNSGIIVDMKNVKVLEKYTDSF